MAVSESFPAVADFSAYPGKAVSSNSDTSCGTPEQTSDPQDGMSAVERPLLSPSPGCSNKSTPITGQVPTCAFTEHDEGDANKRNHKIRAWLGRWSSHPSGLGEEFSQSSHPDSLGTQQPNHEETSDSGVISGLHPHSQLAVAGVHENTHSDTGCSSECASGGKIELMEHNHAAMPGEGETTSAKDMHLPPQKTESGMDRFVTLLHRTKTQTFNNGLRLLKTRTLLLTMVLGSLAFVLLIAGMATHSWRVNRFQFPDDKGLHIVTVNAGLIYVQRIQMLMKVDNSSLIYMTETPLDYMDLMLSEHCLFNSKDVEQNVHEQLLRDSDTFAAKVSARLQERLAASGSFPLPENEDEKLINETIMPSASVDSMAGSDHSESGYVGRTQTSVGLLDEQTAILRTVLLGPTNLELECKHLGELYYGGKVLWILSIVICACLGGGIGIAALIFVMDRHATLNSSFEGGPNYQVWLENLGGMCWFAGTVIAIVGFAYWGGKTDISACVTVYGDGNVCAIGYSAAFGIAAVILTSFCFVLFVSYFVMRGSKSKPHEESEEIAYC